MKVKVELGGFYRDRLGRFHEVEIGDNATVEDVLKRLGIESGVDIILIKNGKHTKPEEPVKDGDQLVIFPPIGGGIFE